MQEIIWRNVFTLAIWHVAFLYVLFYILPECSNAEFSVLLGCLWWLSGLGVTAGSHRLWSHRSYSASPALKWFLMCMHSMAYHGSIYSWVRDHRTHHRGSETNADPHNAKRGFFFAHCGWVMVRKHPDVIAMGKKLNLDDLHQDPIVMFQRKHYFLLAMFWCYVFPTLLGWCLFGNASHGFWLGGHFRHLIGIHLSWSVNSFGHLWGDRPYADINPADNLLLSIGVFGEGWHNYHHKYPFDYAGGEFGILMGQWNPTKAFIDMCAAVGLAWDLKRSRTAKGTRERRMAL